MTRLFDRPSPRSNDTTMSNFLEMHDIQPDAQISFVYNGGSRPGTRRTVTFIGPHELRSGAPGFRANHDGRHKTYEIAKCVDFAAIDSDSDSDATQDDDLLGLRIENNDLKRRLEQANVEIASLKRARKQAVDDVTKILTALLAE